MTALNQTQSLDAAAADLHAMVDAFKAKWLAGHAANPEHFPLSMAEGDWFEQFLAECSST